MSHKQNEERGSEGLDPTIIEQNWYRKWQHFYFLKAPHKTNLIFHNADVSATANLFVLDEGGGQGRRIKYSYSYS